MKKPTIPVPVLALTPAQEKREERLKQWRREEARSAGLPTFFIFSDTVLLEIAVTAPASLDVLQEICGVGQEKANRFGAKVLEIVKE